MGIPMRRVKNKPTFTHYPYTELNWVYDYSMQRDCVLQAQLPHD